MTPARVTPASSEARIRVAVMGAAGRMGTTVCRAVLDAADMELVAVIDPPHEGRPLDDFGVSGTDLTLAMLGPEVKKAEPQVAVDFTHVEAARGNLRWCGMNGVHAVVGTTGLTSSDFQDLSALFDGERANADRRPQLRHRGGAHDAPGRHRRALVRVGRDHRAPPRQQARRPVRHGDADRQADGRVVDGMERPTRPRPTSSRVPGAARARPVSGSTPSASRAWWPTRRCCSAPPASR